MSLLLSGCAGDPKKVPRVSLEPEPIAQPALDPARMTVINTAQDMLGRPYRYGGNGPRSFDCSGLVRYSHARAGIRVPRTAEQQFQAARPIHDRRLQPGDLVFFDIGGRTISHVGIYIGRGEFIHAPSSGKQVSVESMNHPYWRSRVVGMGHYFYDDRRASITSDGQ